MLSSICSKLNFGTTTTVVYGIKVSPVGEWHMMNALTPIKRLKCSTTTNPYISTPVFIFNDLHQLRGKTYDRKAILEEATNLSAPRRESHRTWRKQRTTKTLIARLVPPHLQRARIVLRVREVRHLDDIREHRVVRDHHRLRIQPSLVSIRTCATPLSSPGRRGSAHAP